MIINLLKIPIFVIILLIAIYFYVYSRKVGCKDDTAINYNPDANISANHKCRYHKLGCMDKNAGNYNMFATTSCEEDCIGCEVKGTCDLCKFTKSCKNLCPECICQTKLKGCNRDWALNYDPNATDDNGTCISPDDIFRKISIISGGDCKNCSGLVSVKIGDEYPILNGKQGINVLVLERNIDLTVKHNRAFATGNYEMESKEFVDFMRQYVFYKDIVILAVRGDAVGKKKQENENGEIVYMTTILSEDAKMMIKQLGGQVPEISRQGSYILVGSFLNDIYFETYSSKADSYFPYFNLTNFGCFNFNNPKFEKIQLDLNKFKFLQATGDSGDEVILDEEGAISNKIPNLDMNRVDVINRCALEVIQLGYRAFSVSKGKCYIYKLKEGEKLIIKNKEYDLSTYFRNKMFLDYNEDNKFVKLANYICNLNTQLLPYGNSNEESMYFIDEIYYSGLFSMIYGGQMVEMYNIKDFKGMKTTVGVGVHEAVGTLPKSPDSNNEIIHIPITSLKIPNGFRVTLFRNITIDEDMSIFKKYKLLIDDQFNNFKMLDLSCCEGAKIKLGVTETGEYVKEVYFRIFENIIKNLEIQRKENEVKLYIFNNLIDRDLSRPEIDNRYELVDTFTVTDYYEIKRLKEYNGVGKTGKIEFYGFNNEKIREIYFDTWENFWYTNLTGIINQWQAVKDSGSTNNPYLGIVNVSVVDTTKELLSKTRTLFGYSIDSSESKSGLTHKKCNNIPKYGNCDNNEDTAEPYTNDIKYLIVSKQDFGISFYEEPDYQGLSITLSYGKYNLPIDLCMIIRSIKVFIKFSVIKLYLDFNFKNEFVRIVNNNNKTMNITRGEFKYSDLNNLIPENRKIKSISIEKITYNSYISNNPYPEDYSENIVYGNYQYPIKHELSPKKINYLDYCYDYFKDDITFDTNDKFVRIVKEFHKYGFLKQITQNGNLNVINSGGGIDYIRINLSPDIYNTFIASNFCFLKTYDENNILIRKIIIYNSKILRMNNNDVIVEDPITNLDFSIQERVVKIFYLDDYENSVYANQIGFIFEISKMINEWGKYLAIKKNGDIVRINYQDLDLQDLTNKKINVYAYDNNVENLVVENINNSTNTQSFDFFIVPKIVSTETPDFCKCTVNTNEYDIKNYIYYRLTSFEGTKLISTINLARKVTNLRQLNILDDQNNYNKLSNIKGSRYNDPLIVQILNTKKEVTKTIYFNGQKYIINENINNLNKVNDFGKNDNIYISKHEKKADIFIRDLVSFNDNYTEKYSKSFNMRKDLNSMLENYIDSSVVNINNILGSSGRLQTKDSKGIIIKDKSFNKNYIESIGHIGNIQEINFETSEKIISFYNSKNKKILTLPFQIRIVKNSIISLLKYYLQNKKCILKLFDINRKLIKIGLCKENKYIFKNNGRDLSLDYKQYYDQFDEFNWIYSKDNYTFNLDEIYLSIEMEGVEVFFMEVNIDNTMKTFDNLLESFGMHPSLGPIFLFFIKTKLETAVRFFDVNDKVTKLMKFTFDKMLDESNSKRDAIILYNSPIQYFETYNNDIKYNFYQKDKLILGIKIPKGMNGVYSYIIDNKSVFVNKVICKDKKNVELYDEKDNLIAESNDFDSHEYILGIEIEKYNTSYILEYYPKIGKTIIRLLDKTDNIDKIELEEVNDLVDIELKDQLDNDINAINESYNKDLAVSSMSPNVLDKKVKKGKNMYILENNFYTLKITNPNNFFVTRTADAFNSGNF